MIEPTPPPLADGTRVSRDPIHVDDPRRFGTVTQHYLSAPQRGVAREDWVLYEVHWDQGFIERGYMREGLRVEPAAVVATP